jgi:hypothetical protein
MKVPHVLAALAALQVPKSTIDRIAAESIALEWNLRLSSYRYFVVGIDPEDVSPAKFTATPEEFEPAQYAVIDLRTLWPLSVGL